MYLMNPEDNNSRYLLVKEQIEISYVSVAVVNRSYLIKSAIMKITMKLLEVRKY